MRIRELCEKIGLQEDVKCRVLDFSEQFSFESVRELLETLKKGEDGREALEELLAPDEGRLKMLSCMLWCGAEIYDLYVERGISEKIYIDTMKCFPRFIGECKEITGTWAFDREFWTSRQVGGRLFRIGELEYEMEYIQDEPIISVHIPSDAVFSPEKCEESIEMAKTFFRVHFPEFLYTSFQCHSWLLAPELKQFLPPESNILQFQKRFCMIESDCTDTEYITWIFRKKDVPLEALPERTSLQRKMKQYLMQGEKISTVRGVMKEGKTCSD